MSESKPTSRESTSRRFRRKRKQRTTDDINEEIAAQSAKSGRRYWPYIVLGLFLLGLYLLPNLASSRTVRGWLVESVSEGYPVQIEVEGASAGWFSPIVLYGVHVTDLEGEPLLDAQQIICRSSLSSLMFNSSSPGVVRVEQPTVLVRITHDSSNWERTIAQLPASESSEPLDLDAAVEVVEGTVIIEDMVTGRSQQVTQVNGRVDYPRGNYKPLTAKLAATVAQTGSLQLNGEWFMPMLTEVGSSEWGSGQMALSLKQVPLDVTSPALRRLSLATSAQGTFNTELTATRAAEGGPIRVELASLSAQQINVVQPSMFNEQQVTLQEASLVGNFNVDVNNMNWNGVQFRGDLGSISTAGGVNFTELANSNYEAAFADYAQHLEGRVEIAALARTFPSLLTVRKDVRLQSGQVAFHFDNGLVEHEGQARVDRTRPGAATKWAGSVQMTAIEAVTQQGQVHSIPPASLTIAATNTPTGIHLDTLQGQGEFFALRGNGSLAQGRLKGNVSLDKLQQELQPVLDLRGIQLAGIADIQANWARGEQAQWGANARVNMTDWQLTLPEMGVWKEPNLTVNANLTGLMQQGSLEQLQQGEVAINAGADLFTLRLLKAVDFNAEVLQWPVSFTLQGDATRWQTRLAAFLPMYGTRVEGQLNGMGQLVLGANQISWQDLKLHAEPLTITTASMRIDEPLTDITSTGAYGFANAALNLQQLQLVSTSVSVQGEQIKAEFAAAKPLATGSMAFRGDWSRLSRWFVRPNFNNQPVAWRMEGTFEGSASMVAQNDQISGSLSMLNKNTAFYQLDTPASGSLLASSNVPKWKLAWTEPEATVNGKLSYRPQAGLMQLENLSVASNMLQLAIAGNVSDIGGRAIADMRGTMQYDLAKLSSLLQTQVGNDFRLTGTKKSEFSIRGPLSSDLRAVPTSTAANNQQPQPLLSTELEGGGGLAWEGANLYGLPVGASSINTQLQQSVLMFDPIDVPISQGRLRVKSKLYLYEPTPTLAIEKGRIVDNVEITTEMCNAWLGYVTPLMANATRVKGRLSLDLNDSQIPLGNPQMSNTSGSLAVSNAQVGPGPLSEVVIFIGNRIHAFATGNPAQAVDTEGMVWVNVPQQQVPFAVREGRVYHEKMSTNVGSVQIITSGSVGFDQSLQLMAEVPIRREWFQNQRGLLASMQGQKLQIPVTGTVTNPQIDSRVFEQIARQGIQGAATDLLNEGLRQGFGRLFGPGPE